MLSNFLWSELNRIDLEDLWFQQDGAACHIQSPMKVFVHPLLRESGPPITPASLDPGWPESAPS